MATQFFVSEVASASNLVDRPKRALFGQRTVKDMLPSVHELAEQLDLMPLLNRLADKQNPPSPTAALTLQDEADDIVLQSYFDAAAFMGETLREQTRLESFRARLQVARDKSVEMNNALNFISSGSLNTVGSALAMSTHINNPTANVNQLIAGVVSTGLSGYALKQNHSGRTFGWSKPTVVAELFGRPTDSVSRYPETVWRFFHCKMPDSPNITRAQWLENFWIERKHLEADGSRRQQRKLDIVCGVPSRRKDVTIEDVSDQIDMIGDIEITTAEMIHQLRNLLTIIHNEPATLHSGKEPPLKEFSQERTTATPAPTPSDMEERQDSQPQMEQLE